MILLQANNKGIYQTAHSLSLISACAICYLQSMIFTIASYKKFNILARLCSLASWFEHTTKEIFLEIGPIMITVIAFVQAIQLYAMQLSSMRTSPFSNHFKEKLILTQLRLMFQDKLSYLRRLKDGM